MPSVRATLINSNPQEITSANWADICTEIFSFVIAFSPVDTGEYQSAWQIKRIASDIYEIFNPMEYASFLEDGWSDQAPNGVLEPALDELPNIMRAYIGRRPRGEVTVSLEIPDYEPVS